MNNPAPTKYFSIFRAIHRGGLSLLLNRRALMPMTLIPTLVTFLTLMVMRANFKGDEMPSTFVSALIQLPSDFVTGMFCALIIFIIMNAPKKDDKDAPVMFSLNIMERKDLLLSGAIAYTVFGYLASGVLGAMQILFEPLQAAAQNESPPNIGHTILLFALAGVMFYGLRFIVLPILIIGKIDIRHFYSQFKAIGFSLPIFIVKIATTFLVGIIAFMIISIVLSASGGEIADANPTQLAIVDFVTAFGTVIMAAWSSSALAMGVRKMVES